MAFLFSIYCFILIVFLLSSFFHFLLFPLVLFPEGHIFLFFVILRNLLFSSSQSLSAEGHFFLFFPLSPSSFVIFFRSSVLSSWWSSPILSSSSYTSYTSGALKGVKRWSSSTWRSESSPPSPVLPPSPPWSRMGVRAGKLSELSAGTWERIRGGNTYVDFVCYCLSWRSLAV